MATGHHFQTVHSIAENIFVWLAESWHLGTHTFSALTRNIPTYLLMVTTVLTDTQSMLGVSWWCIQSTWKLHYGCESLQQSCGIRSVVSLLPVPVGHCVLFVIAVSTIALHFVERLMRIQLFFNIITTFFNALHINIAEFLDACKIEKFWLFFNNSSAAYLNSWLVENLWPQRCCLRLEIDANHLMQNQDILADGAFLQIWI